MLKNISKLRKKLLEKRIRDYNPRIHISRLSQSLFDTISAGNIIYAEYAEAGAMGCAGQAIFYILEEENLVCYRTSVFSNEDLYCQVKKLLLTYSNGPMDNNPLFDYYYGGMGNHVYINKNITLKVAEDYFVYTRGNENYNIYCSVLGVFDSVVDTMKNSSIK